jgi:uncharacterized membrane protein YbhN (UPF0104 family)
MRSEALDRPAAPVPREATGRRRRWMTLLSIGISGGLLFLLYRSMDVRQIGRTLAQSDTPLVLVSILAILPITVLRAMRFFWIAPAGALPGIAEAVRLTLLSSALNVFVPAKAGDLAKSFFVARRSQTPSGVAIGIVVYERLCDMFALVTWCLIGWALARPEVSGLPVQFWLLLGAVGAGCALLVSSERVAGVLPALVAGTARHPKLRRLRELAAGWPQLLRGLRGRRRWIVFFSVLLWLAHLFQIWMFTVALRVPVPFAACASLAAVALMAGQLPLTFAGLGTRDVALVVLLAGYMAAEPAAALGVLISTRNFLPPLVGVPLMWRYVSAAMEGRPQVRDAERQRE